jgi:hypothetical protein
MKTLDPILKYVGRLILLFVVIALICLVVSACSPKALPLHSGYGGPRYQSGK